MKIIIRFMSMNFNPVYCSEISLLFFLTITFGNPFIWKSRKFTYCSTFLEIQLFCSNKIQIFQTRFKFFKQGTNKNLQTIFAYLLPNYFHRHCLVFEKYFLYICRLYSNFWHYTKCWGWSKLNLEKLDKPTFLDYIFALYFYRHFCIIFCPSWPVGTLLRDNQPAVSALPMH